MNDSASPQTAGPVDVQQLMAEIRAEVEWKRRAGVYPPDVLEELDSSATSSHQDYLDAALQALRRTTTFSAVVPTASQKRMAPLASSFKTAVQKATSWYMSAILQQVELFASRTVRAIGLLADRVSRVETDLDQRTTDRVAELRATVTKVSEELADLRREAETTRLRDRVSLLERSVRGLRERAVAGPALSEPAAEPAATARSLAADLSIDYLDFENQFRGSEADIKEKQRSYVALFADVSGRVLDLGCGRGEFLELLREAGVDAYGVDRHQDMVDLCAQKGLEAQEADAIAHLSSVAASSLGGIFCAQMVEHLDVRDVPRLFELSADAIVPGGVLVVETLNPASVSVMTGPFYVDLGHLRPLHPLSLKFLAEKAGFASVDIVYHARPSDDVRPQPIPPTGDEPIDSILAAVNENFHRIDDAIFGPQDYAVVARR